MSPAMFLPMTRFANKPVIKIQNLLNELQVLFTSPVFLMRAFGRNYNTFCKAGSQCMSE